MFIAGSGLYVIRIPDGPCKIGRTRDLQLRFAKMQTHHPYELEIVAWLPGRGHEELAWHHCFDEHRIRGEWFKWVPQIEWAAALASQGFDWTEQATAPPALIAELGFGGVEAADVYRKMLREWIADREQGVRGTGLPARPNTPVTPKSTGPVPKHRRIAQKQSGG